MIEIFIMAVRSLYTLLALVLSYNAIALQVTPNSPCSSVCLDSTTLDSSDPNSSNTDSSDIVCEDVALNTTSTGSKWKQCMTCLQTSTFEQGSESDQYWFMCEFSSTLKKQNGPHLTHSSAQTISVLALINAYMGSLTVLARDQTHASLLLPVAL